MAEIILESKETVRRYNEFARHSMIHRLLADIMADMQVCDIEGYDKKEYINQIREIINSFDLGGNVK